MPDLDRSAANIGSGFLSAFLAGFGLWCLYWGWIAGSRGVQDGLPLIRLVGAAVILWAAWEVFQLLRRSSRAGTCRRDRTLGPAAREIRGPAELIPFSRVCKRSTVRSPSAKSS
jgi:hypothetical protein